MLTRREALASMTLAAGAAVVPLACKRQQDAEIGTNFRYSLNTSTILGKSNGIERDIKIASQAGFDYIEVWIRDIEAYVNGGNTIGSLRGYTEANGLKIASAIGFAPWMTGGEEGFEQMEREMNLLAELGCPRIAAPPAGVDGSEALDLFEIGERYRKLLELGRKTGVMPQLEFWGASTALWHMGQVLMIVAASGDPDARILPDVYHMFRGGSDFNTLKMINGSLIDLFHINDYPADKARLEQNDADRVFPGEGAAPLSTILSDLHTMGGEKILSLELFNREYWEEDPLDIARTGLEKMKSAVNAAINAK